MWSERDNVTGAEGDEPGGAAGGGVPGAAGAAEDVPQAGQEDEGAGAAAGRGAPARRPVQGTDWKGPLYSFLTTLCTSQFTGVFDVKRV